MGKRLFARQGLGYVMSADEILGELAATRIRTRGGETHAEIRVSSAMVGTRSSDGVLHQASLNFGSTTARKTLAGVLRDRSNAPEVDWTDLLEDFCRRVLAAERQGQPTVRVGAMPIELDKVFRCDPVVPIEGTTILYGAGGTGKSTLAAAIALSVETGVAIVPGFIPRRAPVLYLDWEGGQNSLNRRIRGVAMGGRLPNVATIAYRDCRRRGALYTFAEDIAGEVDREGYGLVVVDSVGMASGAGGEASDANESTIRLFLAFGYIGTTILAIDHVKKEDKEDDRRRSTPYGSVFKENLARATWELRSSANEQGSYIGLYNQKVNDFDKHAPISLSVRHHDDGSIEYDQVAQLPVELTRHLSQRDQITAALRTLGHLETNEIAEATGLSENTIRAVLSRYRQAFNRLPSGKWEALTHAS